MNLRIQNEEGTFVYPFGDQFVPDYLIDAMSTTDDGPPFAREFAEGWGPGDAIDHAWAEYEAQDAMGGMQNIYHEGDGFAIAVVPWSADDEPLSAAMSDTLTALRAELQGTYDLALDLNVVRVSPTATSTDQVVYSVSLDDGRHTGEAGYFEGRWLRDGDLDAASVVRSAHEALDESIRIEQAEIEAEHAANEEQRRLYAWGGEDRGEPDPETAASLEVALMAGLPPELADTRIDVEIRRSGEDTTVGEVTIGEGGDLRFGIDRQTGVMEVPLMTVPDTLQGQGVASAMIGELLAFGKSEGATAVTFEANMSVGGYAWAKLGAVPTPESYEVLRETRLDPRAEDLPPDQRERYDEIMEPDTPTVIRDLAASELGKPLLLGSSWVAVMDLNDETAQDHLEQYTKTKETTG